jgi:hypothetical protein
VPPVALLPPWFLAPDDAAMLTQIYEVSTPKEARSIAEIGVDHIGVLVGNGAFPRELTLRAATEVAAAVVPPSKVSALFLTSDIALIARRRSGPGARTSVRRLARGRHATRVHAGSYSLARSPALRAASRRERSLAGHRARSARHRGRSECRAPRTSR